jgi:pyruvate formate lyase activating enzyme
MAVEGIIFDIKKFAVHDGPGIRSTVFLKGCPLRCPWCHNPEGISAAVEIMVFSGRCLKGCRDCLAACPLGALAKTRHGIVLDRALCDGCGLCADVCPAEALQPAGRRIRVDEVMDELLKDAPFYEDSRGGITFSGGEPLQQPQFLRELLQRCRGEKLHTAVDTSGHAPYSVFESILPLTDLFLFDLKIVDDGAHERLTGVSNRLLLDNLRRISQAGRPLAIRIPLVPGCNDADRDLEQTADFCAALPSPHPVHILPYHRGYAAKFRRLGRAHPLPATLPPSPGAQRRAADIFSRRKLTVKIGG